MATAACCNSSRSSGSGASGARTKTLERLNRRGLGFLLLGLLYLAADLVEVRADNDVVYTGKSTVSIGDSWEIECKLDDDETIDPKKYKWTRNGQPVPTSDLLNGLLQVNTDFPGGRFSILRSQNATEADEGAYKCLDDDDGFFTLTINLDIKFAVIPDSNKWIDLHCPKSPDEPIVWLKDGKEFKHPEDFKVGTANTHVRYINDTGTLQVSCDYLRRKEVFGKYTCRSGVNTTINYRVVPKPVLALPADVNVVEGERLHLTCGGIIEPGVKIVWVFGNRTYAASDDRVRLAEDERKIANAIFKVDNITMEDRGNVTCRASYNFTEPNAIIEEKSAYLRVKDKYAALWPFLGIVAEVIILCTIIFIYEKKRNKSELEESDTDNSPDTRKP